MVAYSSTFGLFCCIIICLFGNSSGQRCFEDFTTFQTPTTEYNRYYNNYYHSNRNNDQSRGYYKNLICDHISPYMIISFEGLCSELKCESLVFKNSNISVLPTNIFTKLSSLETIDMSNSGIQAVEVGAFSGLSKVKLINLYNNQITTISRGVFNSLVSLNRLDLSRNMINNIESSSFHGSSNIQNLDLSFNNLESIPESLFQPLTQLISLDLSNNFLKSVNLCYEFSILNRVALEKNRIEEFPTCASDETLPNSLREINLGGNNLSKLNISSMKHLTGLIQLDLSDNNFSSFPSDTFETFSNLEILDISGNELNEIEPATFTGLKSLNSLNIRGNNITSLDINSFVKCSNIKNLDLSSNTINSIPLGLFQKIPHLKKLNISKNDLEFLHSGVFNTLNELSELYISQNNIEYLETHIFFPLENLTILDISYNNIKNFKFYNIDQSCPHLESIDINGNSISCKVLESLFLSYKRLIKRGDTVNSENIGGIACSDSNYPVKINDHKNDINGTNYINRGINDFFNKDFEKTKFYKFFNKFEIPSKNPDMKNDNGIPDMLDSLNKLLNDTSLDLHNRTEEFMEYIENLEKNNKYDKNDTLNFIKSEINLLINSGNSSLYEILVKLTENSQNTETKRMNALNETLAKLTETLQNTEAKRMNALNENFSKLTQTLQNMDTQRMSALQLKAPTAEMIIKKEGTDELIAKNSRLLSEETKNLNSIFHEIRFFIITIMLITLGVFGVKLYKYSQLGKVIFKRKNDDNQSHDMPILNT